MFGDNQRQIEESFKLINKKLEMHSVILEDYVKYKLSCEDRHNRTNDKLGIIMANQEKVCNTLKENQLYHEKNAENLQTLTDVIVTAKTSKKSIPWIMAFIGAAVVIIAVTMITVNYISSTIGTLLH